MRRTRADRWTDAHTKGELLTSSSKFASLPSNHIVKQYRGTLAGRTFDALKRHGNCIIHVGIN